MQPIADPFESRPLDRLLPAYDHARGAQLDDHMDIGIWLRGLGLERYETLFRENAIDADVLHDLTDDHLREIGLPLGARLKLRKAISALVPRPEPISPALPVAPSGPPADAAERRQVTVMFSDLVGSTPLAVRMDPEDLREIISAYQKCVAETVQRYDGFVARYMGDGVLVHFGYPRAHEDDAERAVRAGLELVMAVAALKSPTPLQTRIGIATGIVVVGELIGSGDARERAIVGKTPNLAARLQGIAKANTVVICDTTRRLLGNLFELEDLGARDLKGITEPTQAWAALRASSAEGRFEAMHATGLTVLVGREEEFELLRRRWSKAKTGEGQVVLLSGEAGIGKSRLMAALLESLASEPHARLRHFCSPHHANSPLYPFIAQLERAARFELGSSDSAKLDMLEALLKPTARNLQRDLGLIADLLSVPADGRCPALPASPQQKREMTLAALLDQLDGVAANRPVLILFEDIHWIDPTSLDLLERTIARVADLPVLLVITLRPEFQPSWIGQAHVTMLPLSRLGRRDSTGIIGGVTKGKALPDVVLEQVLAHTDGVPLFIEELTRTLLESGLLRETTDSYVLDGPLPPLAIPTSLQASLMARLDRLAPVKDVAQIGAAIGREFSYELLSAVASLAAEDLDPALERLTASGIISRRGTPPAATYSFKHVLVQDAAYASLLRSRRRQLHASIAKLLVERFPTQAESLPEVVAYHFTEAGLASEAIGYWLKAGRLAYARSANHEAVKLFETALQVLEALPESQSTLEQGFDLRLELRPVLSQLGGGQRMLDCLREAGTIAERLKDDRRHGRVDAFMTVTHSLLGELDKALMTGSRALEIAGRLGDLRLRILGTSYLVQVHYERGEHDRVIELATGNLTALPVEWINENFGIAAPPSVWDRSWLIMSLSELGRFVEAAKHQAEVISLAEPTQHAFTIALANFAAATRYLLEGDWTQAHSSTDRWIAVSRTGNFLQLPWGLASSAWALAQLGAASEALDRLEEGEHILKHQAAKGIVSSLGWAYYTLGSACLALDRLDDARRLGELALASSDRCPGYAAHALHLLGEVATHPDRFDGQSGEAYYRRALTLGEPRAMRPLVACCHLGLGKLARRTGKNTEAKQHLVTATTMYREMDMRFWLAQAEGQMRQLQ
jgi:class 3 adenylate cyclase/tetratricopeptide (TPR) repeat protein